MASRGVERFKQEHMCDKRTIEDFIITTIMRS